MTVQDAAVYKKATFDPKSPQIHLIQTQTKKSVNRQEAAGFPRYIPQNKLFPHLNTLESERERK